MGRLKERLRARTSEAAWKRMRLGRRRIRESFADGVAAGIAGPLRLLPNRVVVGVREKLALSMPIDYGPSALRIHVGSPVEWEMRRHPCRKEPETVAWLESQLAADDVLYDIGANVGAYSLVAAAVQPSAMIYSFEPGYSTYASLCANVRMNGLDRQITPLAIALADQDGPLTFGLSSADAGAASHPGLLASGAHADSQLQLAGMRLDTARHVLGLPAPTHIKLDVDGGETLVLEGAPDTLRDSRLRTILVEVDELESDIEKVEGLLRDAGFELVQDVRHAGSLTHNRIYDRVGD